jgi:hypothetical protein
MSPEIVHLKVVDDEKFNQTMDRAYTGRNGRSPKVEIIKVIRTLTGLGLKEAKGLMESLVDDGYTVTLNLTYGDDVTLFNSQNVLEYFGIGMLIGQDESIDEDVVGPYNTADTLEKIAMVAIDRKDFDILDDVVKLLKKLVQVDDRA